MKYKIADVVLEYEAKYDIIRDRGKKYIIDDTENTDIYVEVSDKDMQKYVETYPLYNLEFAEYMLTGMRFYKKLLDFDGCMLHSSAVVVDDEAYLFSANSGTGKSTHTELWLKYLADKKPYILNDDKPAIRIYRNEVFAYGTPFSGKNDISVNKKVKVKGICFIERSKVNHIRKLEAKEAIPLFYGQTIRGLGKQKVEKLLDIMEIIIRNVPIYKLYCDMSGEAVEIAYSTMKKSL